MQGDTLVQLVVLCAEKPTQGLLRRVAAELPVQLANISTEHAYSVSVDKDEGAVIVTDGQITVKVSLTSPLLREQNQQHGKRFGWRWLVDYIYICCKRARFGAPARENGLSFFLF